MSKLWPKWGPYLDLDGQVGTQRDIGAVDAFLPFWQNERSLLFGDFRFKADTQGSLEGNFGAGFRRMMDETWNAGVYGFYDHRKSPIGNLFDQLTFGAELLGKNFDFRGNTYWPVGNTVQAAGPPVTGPSTASVVGTSVIVFTPAVMQQFEYALRGFDAEAGVRIPITPADSPYNLRFYAGGYRFDEPTGTAPVVAGPRLRLEFTDYQVSGSSGARFTVGTEWQTDDVRGSQFSAGLRVRIPLQGEPSRGLSLQERRMTDAIVRDVDIVAATETQQIMPALNEPATVLADGTSFTVINSSTTTGANLSSAVQAVGSNKTVILSGTFDVGSGGSFATGFNQTVGASGFAVRTASGHTATLNGSATITGTNPSGNGTVEGRAGTTLQGLTVISTANAGNNAKAVVVDDNAGSATLTNNTITATASGAGSNAIAVSIGTNTTINATGNTFTAIGTTGVVSAFEANLSQTLTLTNNTFSASGGTTNRLMDLSGNTITGSTGNMVGSGNTGTCVHGGTITGQVSFTDGTHCP